MVSWLFAWKLSIENRPIKALKRSIVADCKNEMFMLRILLNKNKDVFSFGNTNCPARVTVFAG
jgi:hypothetical protein